MTKSEIAAYNAEVVKLDAAVAATREAKAEWQRLRAAEEKLTRAFDAKWNPTMPTPTYLLSDIRQ